MGLSNATLVLMYSLLWLLPLFRLLRCILTLKGSYSTESGREFFISEEKESLLIEKLKGQETFLEKYPAIKKLHYVELTHPELVSTYGFSSKLKPQVLVACQGLETLSPSLYHWLLKRGAFLALTRSYWIVEAVMFMSEVGLILFLGHLCTWSVFLPLFLVFFTSRLSGMYYHYLLELKADEAVTAFSSMEELQEGMALLKAQLLKVEEKEEPLDLRKRWLKKTLNDRIAKLSSALGKENLKERPEKIASFYQFLKEQHLSEEAFIENRKMKVLRWIDADED